jgi:signal transduction histidine kinase
VEVFRPELHAFPLGAILDEARDTLDDEQLVAVLKHYGLTPADFLDRTAWVSLEFVEAFLQDVVDRSGDPQFIDRSAIRCMQPRYIGPLYPLLFAFGSPLFAFRQLSRTAARFNKTGRWDCEESRPGFVRMRWSRFPGASAEAKPFICRFRTLQLRQFPAIFGMAPATLDHPQCLLRGDDSCTYVFQWQELQAGRHAQTGMLAGAALGLASSWALSLPLLPLSLLAVGCSAAGWALGRVWMLRKELAQRTAAIEEHNLALDRITRAHEQRFAELIEAKAEVERKVEQRTAELREATQRLSESLQQIQALDQAKTDFFNNVSHELRSPLTLILAPLEDLASDRTPPGGERRAYESMRRNASRLLRLINQLLDLAKIDAGKMEINPTPIDVVHLVGATKKRFEAAAEQKGVSLELSGPAAMPPIVLDAALIESAISNLIANALRFTKVGGGVRLSVTDGGAEVAVAVADDGPGIATEDQTKVFARFAQGDSSKRVVGGTGIGLALVREAARLHGGDVKLVSEVGKGSTFTLVLPRRPDSRVEAAASRPPSSPPPPRPTGALEPVEDRVIERGGPSATAPLALVVEDNPELREFMADILAVRYRVRTARDGEDGVNLTRQLRPDVVVSDVAMPIMDGYQLCRALRADQETQATPVLLVTARTEIANVLEGFEAGASDYVLKPFHGRELLARVDVHVRLRRMVQELALRERHAMLGVLAASVAHQVRNPLTTLVSGLPAMRRRLSDKVDPSTRDLIDVMVDCASRIELLTTDLMNLSRVDREIGGAYRPSDGLRAALRMIRARVDEAVTVEEEIEDAVAIEGRAGDMNHVFLNLLDNAVRAVGARGRIRVEAWNEDGQYLVRVGDSGPGIDAETAQRIFEPFFTTRPAGEGTGLGLAIAKQVARQNGGSIDLETSELGGAAFVVRIPIASRRSPQPPAYPGVH